MKIEIQDIVEITEDGIFDDEYVYDIQMEDDTDHTFFANDILVHNSAIISIDDILSKTNSSIVDDCGELTKDFIQIEEKISFNLNRMVQEWARDTYNTTDCRFEFKRESACPKAIWVGKKHYIMNIKNSEGVKMDKMKYKGLSVVKSTFSDSTKDIIKDIVKGIFESQDRNKADEQFFKSYENFFNMSINDMAVRSNIKVLKDYSSNGFNAEKGCPRHVKWSIYYNEMVKKLGLENKYPLIEEGKKIKLIYVKPNKYNIDGIAYMDIFPEEFELEPDKETMFEKCVVKCLAPIFDALKWNVPNPKKQYEFSLEEFFS